MDVRFTDTAALRHAPKQTRGQRKVEHILRSAEALFAEMGFEQTTTNAIARRAGVSIGSLYQFFASKEAILELIADHYLEQTHAAMSRALGAADVSNLENVVSDVLDTLIKLQEQRPYFLQCLGRSRPSPVLVASVMRLNESVAAQVVELLRRGAPAADSGVLVLRARICVETMSALLPMAVGTKGRERRRVTAEIQQLLLGYVQPMVEAGGAL